jgi:hypothetical protein
MGVSWQRNDMSAVSLCFQCPTKVMGTNQAWAPLFKSLACFWQLFGAIFLSLHVLWPISGHRSHWIRTQCPPSDAGNPCTLWQQISTQEHNKTHIWRLNILTITCFAFISCCSPAVGLLKPLLHVFCRLLSFVKNEGYAKEKGRSLAVWASSRSFAHNEAANLKVYKLPKLFAGYHIVYNGSYQADCP